MEYTLSENIRTLTPYAAIEGNFKLRLDANESFIPLPLDLIQAVTQTALNGQTVSGQLNRYPDPRAKELCNAFAEFYDVPCECVTAGNGSDELISLLVGTFLQKGDELVTLENDFSMYRFYADTLSINSTAFPKNPDLTIDVDGLIQYVKLKKARGLIFSNPCNPTSLCLEKSEVSRMCRELSSNCLVIVDEAYMDFSSESIMGEVLEHSNLIVLKTASKAVGLAGIRLGFGVAGVTLTKALQSVKSPYNVNSFTQAIGCAVYSHPEYLNICVERIIHSRDNLYQGILSIYAHTKLIEEVYASETNFVFIKVKRAEQIFKTLLKYSIAIRRMGDYLRITAGSKDENTEFLTIFARIVRSLETQEVEI